jgi:hypothetical protein
MNIDLGTTLTHPTHGPGKVVGVIPSIGVVIRWRATDKPSLYSPAKMTAEGITPA